MNQEDRKDEKIWPNCELFLHLQLRNVWEVKTETTSEHRKNISRQKLKDKGRKRDVVLKAITVRGRFGRSLVQYPSKIGSYQRINLESEIV